MKLTWQEKVELEKHFWPVRPYNVRISEGDYQRMAKTTYGRLIRGKIKWDNFKSKVAGTFIN